MNKTELVAAIAKKTKLSQKDTANVINTLIETVEKTLKKGDPVTLIGFGTFEVRNRAARTGFNPRTKKPIKIKANNVPAFKAGKTFKDLIK